MPKFITRGKLSKKARRELDRQHRTLWQHSPVTKTIESKKLYSRKKKSHARYDDDGMGFYNVLLKESRADFFCCSERN